MKVIRWSKIHRLQESGFELCQCYKKGMGSPIRYMAVILHFWSDTILVTRDHVNWSQVPPGVAWGVMDRIFELPMKFSTSMSLNRQGHTLRRKPFIIIHDNLGGYFVDGCSGNFVYFFMKSGILCCNHFLVIYGLICTVSFQNLGEQCSPQFPIHLAIMTVNQRMVAELLGETFSC